MTAKEVYDEIMTNAEMYTQMIEWKIGIDSSKFSERDRDLIDGGRRSAAMGAMILLVRLGILQDMELDDLFSGVDAMEEETE